MKRAAGRALVLECSLCVTMRAAPGFVLVAEHGEASAFRGTGPAVCDDCAARLEAAIASVPDPTPAPVVDLAERRSRRR